MNSQTGCIVFSQLNGFPFIDSNDKISTEQFLKASSEIVDIIHGFGLFFTPIVKDMNGNIQKLRIIFDKNQQLHEYLEDLIKLNMNVDNNCAGDALLWLKRGLQLLCTFFDNICKDKQCLQTLKLHLKDAYEQTLKPFHGFIIQNAIKVFFSGVPTRANILGLDKLHDDNVNILLSQYLPGLKSNLDRIDSLLKQYGLDNHKKV